MSLTNTSLPLNRRRLLAGSLAVLATATAAGLCWQLVLRHPVGMHRSPAIPAGFGAAAPKAGAASLRASAAAAAKVADPMTPVLSLYGAGKYADVERVAAPLIAAGHEPKAPLSARRAAARARHITAFAAARRHDLKTARDRFAVARTEAAALPGRNNPNRTPIPGQDAQATLEEDSAYQHAVCTSALGDKTGAEREYLQFMRDYPESPLVQASIKRIARLHGGDIPKDAEAVWRQAMDTAQARDKNRRRDESVCAPECLAELVRRQPRKDVGSVPSIQELAQEMKTTDSGTSMANLCDAAKRHGFPKARGLALTAAGLKKQALPVVALVRPGHFVLVEAISGQDGAVHCWDPDGKGVGKSLERIVTAKTWSHIWGESDGAALSLR